MATDECLQLTKSIVQTMKTMCRDGLASAHGFEISLAGAVRVSIESGARFIIKFDERVPADEVVTIDLVSEDCEDVVDLTTEWHTDVVITLLRSNRLCSFCVFISREC